MNQEYQPSKPFDDFRNIGYGVNKSLINGIKRGNCWKEYGNTNPFAGLMR